MPSKSPRQRRFFFATKGAKWTKKHHFDKLARKRRSTRRRRKTR